MTSQWCHCVIWLCNNFLDVHELFCLLKTKIQTSVYITTNVIIVYAILWYNLISCFDKITIVRYAKSAVNPANAFSSQWGIKWRLKSLWKYKICQFVVTDKVQWVVNISYTSKVCAAVVLLWIAWKGWQIFIQFVRQRHSYYFIISMYILNTLSPLQYLFYST